MAANYQQAARRVDALRGSATDQNEVNYWTGYREAMADSLPDADPTARAQREAAYALIAGSPARADQSRAVIALGYWDGRRWESREVLTFWQRLTTREWLAAYGQIYGVRNWRYVVQMCAGIKFARATKPAALPYPWTAEKSGDQWIITIKTQSASPCELAD